MPPRIAHQERGPNSAVIWYERPGRGGNGHRQAGSADRAVPRTLPRMRVGMAVPSWGRPCGVGEYSRALASALGELGSPPEVVAEGEDVSRVVREHRVGIVHFQHEYSLWDPSHLRHQALALLREGVHTVATVHALAPVPDHNGVLRDCFRSLILHSEGMRREAVEVLGVPPERVRVIPMGVRDLDPGDRPAARALLGLGDAPAIGFVGFFYPQKGIVELGLAAAQLRAEFPGLRCLIFATAAPNESSRRYREEVCRAFDARGAWEFVALHEAYLPEADLVARLHALDVIVLPYAEYRARQVSAAVRTALSARRPVVTTDVFAFSDLGDEVLKVPSNDPAEIVAAVPAILSDPGRQEALLAAGRRHVEENSWTRVAARHLSLYRSL